MVLVITRLTTSQTGPLHPATVTGRKAQNAMARGGDSAISRAAVRAVLTLSNSLIITHLSF
jgi:hypothetical protein